MALGEQQIKELKTALEEKREEILGLLKGYEKSLDFGSDVDSGDEETDESEEYANYLGVSQALKGHLNRIDEALARIQSGNYGVCEECGADIPFDFLKQNPSAIRCLSCRERD